MRDRPPSSPPLHTEERERCISLFPLPLLLRQAFLEGKSSLFDTYSPVPRQHRRAEPSPRKKAHTGEGKGVCPFPLFSLSPPPACASSTVSCVPAWSELPTEDCCSSVPSEGEENPLNDPPPLFPYRIFALCRSRKDMISGGTGSPFFFRAIQSQNNNILSPPHHTHKRREGGFVLQSSRRSQTSEMVLECWANHPFAIPASLFQNTGGSLGSMCIATWLATD